MRRIRSPATERTPDGGNRNKINASSQNLTSLLSRSLSAARDRISRSHDLELLCRNLTVALQSLLSHQIDPEQGKNSKEFSFIFLLMMNRFSSRPTEPCSGRNDAARDNECD
ncbi:unnamed protein product [Allacma fusca]|uniref:Uncharacterized protein n=1 Tax=Allacma fusca TaxID=39272 RepID=A0A8J2LSI0_9HEXA|nr:unnamed protein product [Allacma fusca]